jgi:hypothetical protein
METIEPSNSHQQPPPLSPFARNIQIRNEPYPSTTASQVPTGIKRYYSNDVFKTVTFFVLVVAALSVATAAFFANKLSSDQFLSVLSSLLFLSTPSPLQRKPKKKIIYQSVSNNPV